MTKNQFDIIILGASLGGVQAAISACEAGKRVYMCEESDWVGGQMTAQAVPPDEHSQIETQGATRRYMDYRRSVREYYRTLPNASDKMKSDPLFWPGESWVSRIAHEPCVAQKLLLNRLAPYLQSGLLTLQYFTKPVECDATEESILSVTVRNLKTGIDTLLKGEYYLDATDCGDLLPLCGAAYSLGAESRKDTGEPHAPENADSADQQPITWVAALEWDEENPGEMEKPEGYDEFAALMIPGLAPTDQHKQFSWWAKSDLSGHATEFSMRTGDTGAQKLGLWMYRRIISGDQFTDHPNEISLLNWPQNDYYYGNIIDDDDVPLHRARARLLTLCTVWWLRNEAPRTDGKGGKGYPVKLCPRVMGTMDGLAKAPYIRESRRIKAKYRITEMDTSKELRDAPKTYVDSVGVGSYAMDLHTTTRSYTSCYLPTHPLEIPLAAMIPDKIKNLIPACKNIGTTHLTSGCYRLHPLEWNIGEVAGHLAAYCISHNLTPAQVDSDPESVRAFQNYIASRGVQLHWDLSKTDV